MSKPNQASNQVGLIVMGLIMVGAIGLIFVLSQSGKSLATANAPEAAITNGKQQVSIAVDEEGYTPSTVKVKRGVPVDLKFLGHSYGCASSIVSRDFWTGAKYVGYGEEQVISFIPQTAGTFRYSCSMGMYVGYIQVI